MEESLEPAAASHSPSRRTSCSCSKVLGGPPPPRSPASPERRRTWCVEGQTLLSPSKQAAWPLGAAALRRGVAWAALAPDPQEEEEEEAEEAGGEGLPETPPRARRAHSLPEGDCCHKCKKRVQFADSLGFSLASVKHYSASEEPLVPPTVLSRLQEGAGPPPGPEPLDPHAPAFHLERDFPGPPPGGLGPEQRVCLERASGSQGPSAGAPQVWVQVRGPGAASVRYTFNDWLSFLDAEPEGPGEQLGGGCSRLCFILYAPPSLQPGGCLQFAIRKLEVGGGESWDSNGGRNYTLRYQVGPTAEPD